MIQSRNMLFSILVANYNNGHFFQDCYQSILSQTYTNWEVIIVDDCSTDESVSVIKQIIGVDDRFKLIENTKNYGCGYTKNKCVQNAKGDILGFLDPDDSSQPILINQYNLIDRVVSPSPPKGKLNRYIKSIQLLFNPLRLYFFIKYWILKKKKSLDYIFILQFYFKFRKIDIFHVHFATAINPLFELKKIGLIKSKIVITFHGYDEHGLPEGRRLNEIISKFDNNVDQITVNSKYLKDKLLLRGFNKKIIKLIPIGYDEK